MKRSSRIVFWEGWEHGDPPVFERRGVAAFAVRVEEIVKEEGGGASFFFDHNDGVHSFAVWIGVSRRRRAGHNIRDLPSFFAAFMAASRRAHAIRDLAARDWSRP